MHGYFKKTLQGLEFLFSRFNLNKKIIQTMKKKKKKRQTHLSRVPLFPSGFPLWSFSICSPSSSRPRFFWVFAQSSRELLIKHKKWL